MRNYVLGILLVMAAPVLRAQVVVVPDTIQSTDARFTYYFSEGLRCKLLGNQEEAITWFQKCVELKPEKPDPFYELGMLSAYKNDFIAAAGYARNAWKRDPSNKFYGQLLIECLARQGKPEECIPVYRELQKSFPEEEGYITGEIEVLIQAKKYSEALKRLQAIGNADDLKRWSVVRQRDIYELQKQGSKGIKVVKKWLSGHPDDFELRGVLAETYASDGQNDKALEQYELLKKSQPGNPAISFSLGQFYFSLGKKEEALREYLTGFRSPDVNPVIKIEIVKQFIENQKREDKLSPEVIELIQVLYEADKGDPGVDLLYANYLYSEERITEAEPIYTKLTQTTPGDFQVWQNLLFILNEKQDFEKIYLISSEALKVFPNQGLFFLFKGMAAISRDQFEEAIQVLNKGLTYPGQNPEIAKQFYISLGEAYYRIGNTTDAFRNYDLLLTLEPDNVLVLNNYAYYLSLENREMDKALDMITRCVQKEKDNPTYLDTYAWVLFKKGNYKEALVQITRVMELDQDPSGEVLEHYGDILFANSMTAEAKVAWIKAKTKGEVSLEIDKKIEKGLEK
jgi:tetratricopeptide (TPR) repeat protein